MSKEIPEVCKFIETCSFSIDRDHYECLCNSANWIHCDFINPKDLKEYKKNPIEWKNC